MPYVYKRFRRMKINMKRFLLFGFSAAFIIVISIIAFNTVKVQATDQSSKVQLLDESKCLDCHGVPSLSK